MGTVVKKKIIAWLIPCALLIVAGMVFQRSCGREDNSDVGVASSFEERAVPKVVDPLVGPAPAAPNQTVQERVIVDERQIPQGNGDVEYRRLIHAPGKYAHRIVVETLRKDEASGRFVPVNQSEMVADQVLVHLNESDASVELVELAAKYNATVDRELSDGHTFVVRLAAPSLDAVEKAVAYFTDAAASIAYAEPDFIRHFSVIPNDSDYGSLWGLSAISMPSAWDISTGSREVVVAVIDTGMDMDHPDLAANLWTNAVEIAGDEIDNDGNGFVDDVNGWDFVASDNDPEDGNGHGTHCSGTIGAVGNNDKQVAGVCWNVSIMPVRAADDSGSLASSDVVGAIYYAADNGAKVLSNSYGGSDFSQTEYDAIDYANDQGCIFVAAAGNDASDNDAVPQYPAGYDVANIISVAATDENDELASFSNYGSSTVDVAAPGVEILSTYLSGGTETLQGTSMACPHVAGAMALLASIYEEVTPIEARQLLMDSVDEVAALNGKVLSGGRLNVLSLFENANDNDRDGIPDSWEEAYGLDPEDPSDAELDADGDSLSNLEEYQNGCFPNDPDSDDDSLIDGWEVLYGFNPRDVQGTLPSLQYLGVNSQCLTPYDCFVTNGYAYVADGAYGLKILSLTSPSDPELVGSYDTAGTARGIGVAGNFAYVADATNGLVVVNVSDPTDPELVTSVPMNAATVAVSGNHAYVVAVSNGLHVVDVSVPENAVETASFTGNGDPDFVINDLVVAGDTVYLAMNGGLGSISTSANASSYSVKVVADTAGNQNCTALFSDGSELYLALEDYGVLVYDLSKNRLGGFETSGSALDVEYVDGLLYVADGAEGLLVLDAADVSNITALDSYTKTDAYGLCVANGYVYVGGSSAGIKVFRSSVDSDSDGMYDSWEERYFGNLDQSYTSDYDSDGISNWGEYLAGLKPDNDDQDGDGLIDGYQEVQIYLTDPRTEDTDSDGLTDAAEINTYETDPLSPDSDSDGMGDQWEIENGLNPNFNDADADPDSDGASNLNESGAGTDPADADTDDDGMSDGWEIDNGLDPLVDDASEDPDGDSLTNLEEFGEKTDPLSADSDADGLSDYEEINTYGTEPIVADSDGDGMSDGWEIAHDLDPLDADSGTDADGDGLTNEQEYLNGSDPDSPDTDADGFDDGWEYVWGTSSTNAADPLVVDDDGPFDTWDNGGQPQDPQQSDPNEDGSKSHPFDAIQEAIDVAFDGCTILVKPGQYYGSGNRNINPGSLNIRILAENQTNQLSTVVRSQGLGPVFVFDGGQSSNTVLSGFTIESSMEGIDCSNGDCGEEHGIVCSDASSPVISNCTVRVCRDDAIYCDYDSNPLLLNVDINTIYEGNGIYALNGSTPTVVDCSISGIYEGCGIHAVDSVGLAVTNTTITDCSYSFGTGRGIWLENDENAVLYKVAISDCQGAIRCDGSSPLIDRCIMANNEAPDAYVAGDMVYMARANIAVWAEESDDADDVQNDEENGGGILLMDGSFPTIQNCLIVSNCTFASDPEYSKGNSAKPYYGLGGGIFAGADCSTRLVNCTVVENSAMTLGGGMTTYGNYVEFLRNDILWSNSCRAAWLYTEDTNTVLMVPGNPYFNTLHCNEGTSHFDPWYCVMSDGFGFVLDRYNSSDNPAFLASGNYHLQGSSSCIDAGTFYSAPLYDLDGVSRPQDGDTDTNNYYSIDIGAYEYINPSVDDDGDGMGDGWEVEHGLNPLVNDASEDPDGDLLTNLREYENGTDPFDSDSDDDSLSDFDEVTTHGTNPLNADSDSDGLSDSAEVNTYGTNPLNADSDSDGLSDSAEVNTYGTDPLDSDSDSDGLSDGAEVNTHGTDPLNADSDSDGLSDGAEVNTHGTNPLNADSDSDGLSDSAEVNTYGTNPLNADSDSDGLSDSAEVNTYGTNPLNADSDSDGLSDGAEVNTHGTDPLDSDSDSDGLSDSAEVNTYGTDPLDSDSDADGLSDGAEVNTHGTDPLDSDSDSDGMPDGWEAGYDGLDPLINDSAEDADDDGLTNGEEFLEGANPISTDTDSDGRDDYWEYVWGTSSTNSADPLFVDDDHPDDPAAYDSTVSSPNENGSFLYPFDSIQEAIDCAGEGVTIVVTNGFYIGQGNVNIDPVGKALTIRSWNGADVTLIDADGLGAGFVFQSGESSNTVIRGFSISTPPGDCNDGDCGFEYGVICSDASSPMILDCIITNCALAGVKCTFASSPVISNTVITACGDGVKCSSGGAPALYGCRIDNAYERRRDSDARGVGILAVNTSGLIVSDTVVSNCQDRGIWISGDSNCWFAGCSVVGNHGGFWIEDCAATVEGCVIEDNIAPDHFTRDGLEYYSTANIAEWAASTNIVDDITDDNENGAGILLQDGSVLTLKNTVLANNRCVALDPDYDPDNWESVPEYGLGGGLYIGTNSCVTNINCTYADNEARRGGGISSVGGLANYLRNTVLWGNSADDQYIPEETNIVLSLPSAEYTSLHCRSGAFNVWYCDIEHGGSYVKPYKYVIEQNPLFAADYSLMTNSPCIDAGNVTVAPDVDVAGVQRPLDGDNDGLAKVDIGAYEYVNTSADTDGDGDLDVDEIADGSDPTAMPAALIEFLAQYGLVSTKADADSDGMSNLGEYLAGTDPTNSASYFCISDVQPLAEGGCEVMFDSVSDRYYTVYWSEQLDGTWNVLLANEPGDGELMVIVDPASTDHCFYKVEVDD